MLTVVVLLGERAEAGAGGGGGAVVVGRRAGRALGPAVAAAGALRHLLLALRPAKYIHTLLKHAHQFTKNNKKIKNPNQVYEFLKTWTR